MNTFPGYRYKHAGWLIMLLLVPFGFVLAQSDVYYQPDAQARKGYWRLSTSLDKRSTIVSFFDSQDQLLYQETLLGYHLKPSRQTTDLLDDFLSQLTTNRLVSAQLQSQLVPFPVMEKRLKRSTESEPLDTTLLDSKNRIYCSINPDGIIRLNILNPAIEPLLIRLIDERGQTLYYTSTQQPEYFSRLNVASLTNGSFRLSVSNEKGKALYTFRLTKSTHAQFDLQTIAQEMVATSRPH